MEDEASRVVQVGADGKVRRQPSRGMYVLPSLFTAGNMAAGFYAITQSIQGSPADTGYFDRAALALGIAVLFDGLDGIIARLTHTTSDFGRELDSLADVITFGVAPSLLAYIWGFRMLPLMRHPELRQQIVHIGVFVCFIFLICGASRLARFNISINPQPRNPGRPGKKYFVGMPIPAGAGVICSVIHYQRGSPIDDPRIAMVPVAGDEFSDGEQLAFLECERDYCWWTSSVPTGCGDRVCGRVDRAVFGVHADHHCDGVSGFGRGGAAGVLVG
jgi:CDP-diacylglycerol--serine O-phosphatidyltransferase